MKLAEVKKNTFVKLKYFDKNFLDNEFIHHLFDSGIFPNTRVYIFEISELQNKIILKINHSLLAIRYSDAKFIEVENE
jgi:Fe2+ transport system protein FeoA